MIQFKKATVAPQPPARMAEDRNYWVDDIHRAAGFAPYLEGDMESVELLLVEVRRLLLEQLPSDHLNPQVLNRCGRYLDPPQEEKAKMIERYIHTIYTILP